MVSFYKNGKIGFVCLLFSSCVSMPRQEQTANLLSVPDLTASIEEGLESSFFAEGEWPEGNWWEMFQSEQLSSFIETALHSNPDLLAVQHKINTAEEEAKVVRSRLFPLIYFNFEESWELLSHHGLYRAFNPKVPINANLVDLTLSFQYEFDFWGKNLHLYRASLGAQKAQEAEAAQVDLVTTTAVAQAYFTLKTNLVRERLYLEFLKVRTQIFELQQRMREHALYSVLSPLLTAEDLLEAEKLVYNIQQEVQTDRHLLNILMGRGPDTLLEVSSDLPPLPEKLTIPRTLSVDLLSRRPDLMAQIWRVEALANEVGAAKADFYPNINLGAFIGLESVLYRFLFNSHSKAMGLEPALHLPIFTAGEIKANLRAKRATFDEAVSSYNGLILRAAQEVSDLLVIAQSLFEQKLAQEEIVDSAELRRQITRLRALSGLDSQFICYAVDLEVIEKELDDVMLLYGQYVAAIKLVKALGGGYQSTYSLPLQAQGGESDN